MHIPMKTPRLRLRLVSSVAHHFEAYSFESFREGLFGAAEALDKRIRSSVPGCDLKLSLYQDLHVAERGGDRYFFIGGRLQGMQSKINSAEEDPGARLKYFPDYDLHLAVACHGGPKAWACSAEGLWITCQTEWLWGRELERFCDSAVGDIFDGIAEEKEEESGEYEPRTTRKYKRN